MMLRLCIIVESFCSQVRNIFPHISLRDLPCHRTQEDIVSASGFPEALVGIFLGTSRNPGFEHFSVVRHNFITDLTLFESNPNIHGQEMMLVLPDQRLS